MNCINIIDHYRLVFIGFSQKVRIDQNANYAMFKFTS